MIENMTAPVAAHRAPANSIFKSEPVIVGAAVLWFFTNVGTLLTERYHILTAAQWPVISGFLIPLVTAAIYGVVAFLLWHVVTPAWKLIEKEAALVGITIPDLPIAPQPAVNPGPAQLPAAPSNVALAVAQPAADPVSAYSPTDILTTDPVPAVPVSA